MIGCIVAKSENSVIGYDGWMPWNLPEDLQHFKKTTLHQAIVMGRKTFDVIGRPLPQRKTYVLTHNQELTYPYDHEVVEVVHSIQPLLDRYLKSDDWLYVCGGAHIYELFLPYIDLFIISEVKGSFKGDTFFPSLRHLDLVLMDESNYQKFTVKYYKVRDVS